MKTSHFRSPKLDPEQHVQVQISLGTPRYWRTEKHGPLTIVRLLAPEAWALRAYRAEKEPYEVAYRARLDKVWVPRIEARLSELSEANPGKELVLLCFEDLAVPENWCHRTIFAAWWFEQTRERIEEL